MFGSIRSVSDVVVQSALEYDEILEELKPDTPRGTGFQFAEPEQLAELAGS